jgi:hypothetical protein
MKNAIYLVAYNTHDMMGHRFADDADGVRAIVREHYRRVFGANGVDVAVDLEALTATVSVQVHRISYRILRYRLDKPAGHIIRNSR